MDTTESIMTRRSVRRFENKTVPDDILKQLLQAAMQAPSAGNQQPWDFIVITDKTILSEIPKINPNASMARTAPLSILVTADLSREKHPGYWVIDCSAAIQNMLLAAHSLGLGAVWTGVYPISERVDGFKKLFSLPENIIPHSLIVIGYPLDSPKPVDRFNQTLIHSNLW
jgi:nitroreductase